MRSNVVGVVELNEKLENIAKADIKKVLTECAVRVRDAAKEKVPVDTGELQKSLDYTFVDDYTVAIGSNLNYAPYVEIGTGIYAGEGTGGLYDNYIGTGRQTPWVYYDPATDSFYTTRGQLGHPYLLPSLLENEVWIKERMAKEINKEVEK